MRAAVTDAHHRRVILEHRADHLEVAAGVVLERMQQHAASAVGQHRLQRQRPGRSALRPGPRGDRGCGIGFVVGHRAHLEGALEHVADHPGAAVLGALVDQPRAQRRVGLQACDALGMRQPGEQRPGRVFAERVQCRLEPEQHADRAAAHLAGDRQAGGAGRVDLVEGLAPERRRTVDLDQQQRQRPAGSPRGRGQHVEVARAEVGVDLEHPASGAAHRAGQRHQLGLVGAQARGGPAVGGPVLDGARGGEAERARAQRLVEQARHLVALARCRALGMVAATLAHHVAAQRRMRHLRADVDRVRQPLERIEVLREALPAEGDALGQHRAGDVLDAFHDVDQLLDAARAQRREAHAAVAEDRGRHAVHRRGRELRVPGRLAVVVGVDVDEARRQQQPARVDLVPAAADRHRAAIRDAARIDLFDAGRPRRAVPVDRRDRIAVERHVGDAGGRARAVDQRRAPNDPLVHRLLLAACPVGRSDRQ